jgi:hypothetical protein
MDLVNTELVVRMALPFDIQVLEHDAVEFMLTFKTTVPDVIPSSREVVVCESCFSNVILEILSALKNESTFVLVATNLTDPLTRRLLDDTTIPDANSPRVIIPLFIITLDPCVAARVCWFRFM